MDQSQQLMRDLPHVAITPTGNLNGRWYITKAANGNSFTVYSTDAGDTTQGFDWMIVQEN